MLTGIISHLQMAMCFCARAYTHLCAYVHDCVHNYGSPSTERETFHFGESHLLKQTCTIQPECNYHAGGKKGNRKMTSSEKIKGKRGINDVQLPEIPCLALFIAKLTTGDDQNRDE